MQQRGARVSRERRLYGGDERIAWQRDPLDPSLFQLTVPRNATLVLASEELAADPFSVWQKAAAALDRVFARAWPRFGDLGAVDVAARVGNISHVRINAKPFSGGDNNLHLSGAGMGLSWTGLDGWQANVAVAAPIGSVPNSLDYSRTTRGWVDIRRQF
jgi:hypothetical protein